VISQRYSFIPLRQLNWRLVCGVFGLLFICLFTYKYLDFVANGEYVSPLRPLIEEGGGALAGLLLFPVPYWVAVRFPLLSSTWWRNLPVHLLAVCVLSFLLTTIMAVERNILFPLVGLGPYHYGYMPVRYLMEFSNHFLVYWVGVSLVYLYHEVRFARERELNQAKLEANLAEAQLQNLRLQLEPHFLFNALNAISATIYEDPRAADEMIGRLSELLRHLLKSDRSQEVTLAREIDLLKLYTRIMEARLEDRLAIDIDVDPAALNALVPQLLLQPLVENSIRYGVDPNTFQARISVRAHLVNGRLHISVRDYGPGFRDSQKVEGGIGLQNTRDRLAKLYGPEHSLATRNAEEGGALVELDLPIQFAPPAVVENARVEPIAV
jgi:hypothetical protein